MPVFRTELPKTVPPFPIGHADPILCLGSCFAEHIGARLRQGKFDTLVNPSGILYNPASIAVALKNLLVQREFARTDLFQHQGLWHSFAHHGSFSSPDPDIALARIQAHLRAGTGQLKKARRLLLTFGTAYVWESKASGQVVANCHKMPSSEFDHRRLTVEECVVMLKNVLQDIHTARPGLQVLLTVSPVVYLREGLIENQCSKAVLILAAEQLSRELDFVHYFPAYELVVSDLRDYRFYEADMAHPNQQAIDYIWQYFSDTFFNAATKDLLRKVERLQQAAAHRPFNPGTAEHQEFLRRQLEQLAGLAAAHPELDLTAERIIFESQLLP